MAVVVDLEVPAVETRERLLGFVDGTVAGLPHVRQRENAGLYVRGLIEQGGRKSLQPTLFRLEESSARYESVQQFLADSPWDPALVVRACAERVVSELEVEAWVLDDTGFPKDGKRSPGVKRQYSGTLGKIGNCQIGVSVHAVGKRGTAPLGWALYLPEEWCEDPERRRKAKIPEQIEFKTKPELGVELIERAAGWKITTAPVLGDQAYGDNTALRERLHDAELEYVLSVGGETKVFAPGTTFTVPEHNATPGRPRSRPRPDTEPVAIAALIAGLASEQWQTVTFRDGPDEKPITSRFCFVRVRAAHRAEKRTPWPPREEWLIAEWPGGADQPSDYWISNLPADSEPERLARLARLRWKIELDYKQLKGELGLDHYEGRSWIGWHHHTALVTVAHGFLTLERLCPRAPRLA
ncbi:MAG: IS701 family transposase [Solirubrobacteraceae bacterium]